jgi:hypothetical protein
VKLNKTFVINFALIVFLILVIGFPAFPDYISHIHRICSASNWEYGVLANNHYTFLNDIAHVFGIQTICSIEEYYISNELITPLLQGFPAIKVSGVFFFDWARLLLSLTYYVLAYNYIKTIQFQPNNIGSLTPVSNLLISTPPFMMMLISPSSDSFVAVVSLVVVLLTYASKRKTAIIISLLSILMVADKSLVLLISYAMLYHVFIIFNFHRFLKLISRSNLAVLLVIGVIFGNIFANIVTNHLIGMLNIVNLFNIDALQAYLSTKNYGNLYVIGFIASIFSSTDMRLINIFLIIYVSYCFLIRGKGNRYAKKVAFKENIFYYNSFFIGSFLFSFSSTIIGGASMARHHIYLYILLFIYLYNHVPNKCVGKIHIASYLFYFLYFFYSYRFFIL